MRKAVLLIAAAITGCTVNVTNPNIGSKNTVTAKADVKADVKTTEPTAMPEKAAIAENAIPSPTPARPPYAVLNGDVPFGQSEIQIMVDLGLIKAEYPRWPAMSEIPTLKSLPPDKRAHIRSKLLTREEMLEILNSVPPVPAPTPSPPSPTPSPPGPSIAPADHTCFPWPMCDVKTPPPGPGSPTPGPSPSSTLAPGALW